MAGSSSSQSAIERELFIIRHAIKQKATGIILSKPKAAGENSEPLFDVSGKLKLAIENQTCRHLNPDAVKRYFKLLLDELEKNAVDPLSVIFALGALNAQGGVLFAFGGSASFGEGRQVSLSQLSIGSLPEGSDEDAVVENIWSRLQLRLRRHVQDEVKRLYSAEFSIGKDMKDVETHLFRLRAANLLKLFHVFSRSPDELTRLYLSIRQSQIESLFKQAVEKYVQPNSQPNNLLNAEYLDRLTCSIEEVIVLMLRMVLTDLFLLANVFSDALVATESIKFLSLVDFESALHNLFLELSADKIDGVYSYLYRTCTTQFQPRRLSAEATGPNDQFTVESSSQWPRHTLSHFARLFTLLNTFESRLSQLFNAGAPPGTHPGAFSSGNTKSHSGGKPKSALRRINTDEYIDYNKAQNQKGKASNNNGNRGGSPDTIYGSLRSLTSDASSENNSTVTVQKSWTRSFGRFLPALVSSINLGLSQFAQLHSEKLRSDYSNGKHDFDVSVSCVDLRVIYSDARDLSRLLHGSGAPTSLTPTPFASGRMPQRVSPTMMAILQQLAESCAMLQVVNAEVQFRSVSAALSAGISEVLAACVAVFREQATIERDRQEASFNYVLLADIEALLAFANYLLDIVDLPQLTQPHHRDSDSQSQSQALRDVRAIARDINELEINAVELLVERHNEMLCDKVLLDSASFDFEDAKEFDENERCSYPIQSWNSYLQALRYDLWSMLCPDAATHVFREVLSVSLGMLERLFSMFKPSSRRIAQFRMDILAILTCVEEFLFSISDSPADLFDLSSFSAIAPDSDNDALLGIHNHCSSLLAVLVVVTSPLDELAKVHRRGFYKKKATKRDREFHNRFESLRSLIGCKPASWLSVIRPDLFAASSLASLDSQNAIYILLRLLFDRPHYDSLASVAVDSAAFGSLETDLALLLRALTIRNGAFSSALLLHSNARLLSDASASNTIASSSVEKKQKSKKEPQAKETDAAANALKQVDEARSFSCAMFELLSGMCEDWNVMCLWQVLEEVSTASDCFPVLLSIATGEFLLKSAPEMACWLQGFVLFVHRLMAPTVVEAIIEATAELAQAMHSSLSSSSNPEKRTSEATAKKGSAKSSVATQSTVDVERLEVRELPESLRIGSILPCGCAIKTMRGAAHEVAADWRAKSVKRIVSAVLDLVPRLPSSFLRACYMLVDEASKRKDKDKEKEKQTPANLVDVVIRLLLIGIELFRSTYSHLLADHSTELVFQGAHAVLSTLSVASSAPPAGAIGTQLPNSVAISEYRLIINEMNDRKNAITSQMIRAQVDVNEELSISNRAMEDGEQWPRYFDDAGYTDEFSTSCFYRSMCVQVESSCGSRISDNCRTILRYMEVHLGSIVAFLDVPSPLANTEEKTDESSGQTLREKVLQHRADVEKDNARFSEVQVGRWFPPTHQYVGFNPIKACKKLGWYDFDHAALLRFRLSWSDLCSRDVGVSELAFRELLSHRPDMREEPDSRATRNTRQSRQAADPAAAAAAESEQAARANTIEILQRRFNLASFLSFH